MGSGVRAAGFYDRAGALGVAPRWLPFLDHSRGVPRGADFIDTALSSMLREGAKTMPKR
jgi:hypothetical protein